MILCMWAAYFQQYFVFLTDFAIFFECFMAAVLILALAETGQLSSVVDKRFPLALINEATRYVEQGHKVGTVAVTQ